MADARSFAIEVNFLTGRYVATHHNDRLSGEWPPHPARLFSAMVATWAEEGGDPEEREALQWLESQGPPDIAASTAARRAAVPHFVPVNDASILGLSLHAKRYGRITELLNRMDEALFDSRGEANGEISRLQDQLARERQVDLQVGAVGTTPGSSADEMLPETRRRQARTFPSVAPDDPRVTYIWRGGAAESVDEILDRLLGRVTRLGHSSSLVSCRVTSEPPEASLRPGDSGQSLRTVSRGQLAELERRYAGHRGVNPRSLPYTDVRYAAAADTVQPAATGPNTAGEWIVFEFAPDSSFLPSTRTVELAAAMRGAILHYAADPIPEEISGHGGDGAPVSGPHVAFLPLPYVGFERADGRLLGIAVSVPGSLSDGAHSALLRAIGEWERGAGRRPYPLRLNLGARGTVSMARLRTPPERITLRPTVWRRPSRRWVSATPIALPRHPGRLVGGTATAQAKAWERAEASVVAAGVHVGLPEPEAVEVALRPFIRGGRPTRHFPAFSQRGRDGRPVRRQLVHASLTFQHPVEGSLMLGAGRFVGLGLMRPVPESDDPPK